MSEDEFSFDFGNELTQKLSHSEKQLQYLTLRIDDFKEIPGKVLVAHCGPQATLVEFLRDKDIQAYGMDARLKKEAPYLIKQHIYDLKPRPGHVPFADNYFVKVISYMHPLVTRFNKLHHDLEYHIAQNKRIISLEEVHNDVQRLQEFSDVPSMEEELQKTGLQASLFFMELVRVTNNIVGQLFVYPNIGELQHYINNLITMEGYEIRKERAREGMPFEFMREAFFDDKHMMSFLDTLDYNTIIQPKDIITL